MRQILMNLDRDPRISERNVFAELSVNADLLLVIPQVHHEQSLVAQVRHCRPQKIFGHALGNCLLKLQSHGTDGNRVAELLVAQPAFGNLLAALIADPKLQDRTTEPLVVRHPGFHRSRIRVEPKHARLDAIDLANREGFSLRPIDRPGLKSELKSRLLWAA
jgi:hypothetical protein